MEVANRQGKQFQTLFGEIVSSGLRAIETGHSLQDVVDFYEIMELQRASGAALIPVDLCNHMISKLCETEKEVLTQKWREAGSWYGKYLDSKFSDRDTPEMLGKLLTATRWDLGEVQVVRNGSSVRFRCIAPHLPDDATHLLAAFVEGGMSSLNHKLVGSEVLKGMILQEFTQSKK